jgi:hypothetical protein
MSLIVASYLGIVVNVHALPVSLDMCQQALPEITLHVRAQVARTGGLPDKVKVECVAPGNVLVKKGSAV